MRKKTKRTKNQMKKLRKKQREYKKNLWWENE